MLVHCFNPECKSLAECRKPAHDVGEPFEKAFIRSAVVKYGCLKCGSKFVEVAQRLCFACLEKGESLPHNVGTVKILCAECRQGKCRVLKDLAVSTEEDECPICCEDVEEGDVKVQFSPCGDWCCVNCFLQDLDHKINGRKIKERTDAKGVFTTGCIVPTCESLLQSIQCVKLLSKRSRGMFVKFATEAVVTKKLHGEICPFPDCNDAIIELPDEKSAMVVTCLSCERRFCRCCKGESLTGKCPKQENKEEANMLLKSGITPCPNPNCGVNIFRSKGCNRVFCTNCKKNFCWICLELTGHETGGHLQKYAHWMDITKKNKCPLWGGKRRLKKPAGGAKGGNESKDNNKQLSNKKANK